MPGWIFGAGLDRWLERRAVRWALLAAVAVGYIAAYVGDELNPGWTPPSARQGWWSWSDQWRYAESAAGLAGGRIDATSYFYPLGYAALGAPFVRLMPAHPFFWASLGLVLLTAALWWRLARRWMRPSAALALGVVFVATHAALLRLTMVIPWNTLPSQVALLAGMVLVLTRRDGAVVGWLALLAALTYWVRPGDAACMAPMLVWATVRLPTWRARLGWGAVGVVLIAASAAAMAGLNWRTFGHWRTPYEQGTFAHIGFFSYPMLHKAYWLLVDGEVFFGEYGSALLWRYPWLFLAIPGVVCWVRRDGWAGAACVGTIALNWMLYLNYNDFLPSAVFRFSLIHYLSWSFLPLGITAALALGCGWRERAGRWAIAAMVAGFVLALGLRLKERPLPAVVAPGEVRELPVVRPLWVKLPGEKMEKVGALRLDGRVMLEARDYQMPYAPSSDARLLLSDQASGRRLAPAPGTEIAATPVVGDYVWSWWPRWRRLAPPRD